MARLTLEQTALRSILKDPNASPAEKIKAANRFEKLRQKPAPAAESAPAPPAEGWQVENWPAYDRKAVSFDTPEWRKEARVCYALEAARANGNSTSDLSAVGGPVTPWELEQAKRMLAGEIADESGEFNL